MALVPNKVIAILVIVLLLAHITYRYNYIPVHSNPRYSRELISDWRRYPELFHVNIGYSSATFKRISGVDKGEFRG